MLRRYLSAGKVPFGYFYDLNLLKSPCRWTGPTLSDTIMVESSRKGGSKVLVYKCHPMSTRSKDEVFIELYRDERTIIYARYYPVGYYEKSAGKHVVASRAKDIYSPALLKPSPVELISQHKDPSIPSVLNDSDLELSTNYINLNEFNSLLRDFGKGNPTAMHYAESLRLSRKYLIQEERQLTINLIKLLQEKMSTHYNNLVFTNQPIVSKTLSLSEFSTSRPDIYVYNAVRLLDGLKIKAASVHSVMDKRSVNGLAVECKRKAKPTQVLDQALANMVRFGTDLARVTLVKGNQVDFLHLYGICVDFMQGRSSRVLEMTVDLINNKQEVVVYQETLPVAAAINYVCSKLQ